MNQNNLALIGGSLLKFNGLQIFMPDFLSPPTYLLLMSVLGGCATLRCARHWIVGQRKKMLPDLRNCGGKASLALLA